MPDKQQAYSLIDQLGPGQLAALVQLLEAMLYDEDGALSAEDRRAVAASREYFRQNPEGGISFREMAADLGLTEEQIRKRG
jgi:hypothetical protein